MPENSHQQNDRASQAMKGALARWPGLGAMPAEFRAHLTHVGVLDEDLALRGDELYLAFVCGQGQAAALRIFDQEYLTRTVPVIARVNGASVFLQEVQQLLRERLLLGPEPRIAQFAGTGALGAWLRITALRTALNLRKSTVESEALLADAMLEPLAAEPPLPDLYREVVQGALRTAFAGLSAKQRNTLRLHYLEALSLDQIAALYGTHRATAARWLAAAREQIFSQVRECVGRELDLSASELHGVLVQVRSQLDTSVIRLLGPSPEPEQDPQQTRLPRDS